MSHTKYAILGAFLAAMFTTGIILVILPSLSPAAATGCHIGCRLDSVKCPADLVCYCGGGGGAHTCTTGSPRGLMFIVIGAALIGVSVMFVVMFYTCRAIDSVSDALRSA